MNAVSLATMLERAVKREIERITNEEITKAKDRIDKRRGEIIGAVGNVVQRVLKVDSSAEYEVRVRLNEEQMRNLARGGEDE